MKPFHNTVYVQCNVGSAKEEEFVSKLISLEEKNEKSTIADFKKEFTYSAKALSPSGGLTIASFDLSLLSSPLVLSLSTDEQEWGVEDVGDILGVTPSEVTELPDVTHLSEVEVKKAEERWQQFTEAMKSEAKYDSKYSNELIMLDGMGCINLERIDRRNIPNILIDRVLAMFFCPYEDLPHTLELGPVNDAVTMAKLFISRGYKVVYLMDATPKEYYVWMDWLLDNIQLEIVGYFSGHGTQVKDTTGKETDGMSELYVFYNENKKTVKIPKMAAKVGITNQTVSDVVMHELIMLKDYPETRIVLISDCCHSGTMFNFDQSSGDMIRPPPNVVCIGAAKDEQTAKQTVLGGKESGVFTYQFSKLLNGEPKATFNDLQIYMKKNIGKYQDINITTPDNKLLSESIIVDGKQ